MRVAIISDIHSNLEALTKALELIDREAVDETVCLGDIVGYGANPNECIRIVRERCKIILLGNHDAASIDTSLTEDFNPNARSAALWTRRALTEENRQFLNTLPRSKVVQQMLFVHASPFEPEEWHYIIHDQEARMAFRFFAERICFIGHTHVPMIFAEVGLSRTVTKDARYVVNVGSIGQPRDGNPQLSFGLFDTETWFYRNVRSEYDIQTAAKKIVDAGLPEMLAARLSMGI